MQHNFVYHIIILKFRKIKALDGNFKSVLKLKSGNKRITTFTNHLDDVFVIEYCDPAKRLVDLKFEIFGAKKMVSILAVTIFDVFKMTSFNILLFSRY